MSSVSINPPVGPIHATVNVPGSKSVANRALVCAMLASGDSVIGNVPGGDDSQAIIDVLSQMNAVVDLGSGTYSVRGDSERSLPGIIDAQLAGTTSRFLTAVAALSNDTVIIDGSSPLRNRPMADLHEALAQLGAEVTPLGVVGHLPVSISRGQLSGGKVSVRGNISSQFISALMLIGPILPNGLEMIIDGPLVSRSYVEMTQRVMIAFGAQVDVQESLITIGSTGYQSRNYVVEPDYSSAAFPLVAVAIRGGEVVIPSLANSHMQGDAQILEILRHMGVHVSIAGDSVVVSRLSGDALLPVTINMADCSDLVPAVVLACAVAAGESELTGIGFIRQKESDRIGDLASELRKCGAQIEELSDGMRISGVAKLDGASFGTHHDHRLAMSLALSSLSSGSCVINDSHVVTKSWPTFFEDMAQILGPVSNHN